MAAITVVHAQRVIEPDDTRPVDDDILRPQRDFSFPCATCKAQLSLNLRTYNANHLSPEEASEKLGLGDLKEHFRLLPNRSLAIGWPKLRIETCPSCASAYIVCVLETEPSNGWHRWTVRGVSALRAAI